MNPFSPIQHETAVRITSKGQVFLPKALRERAGLVPGGPARVGMNEAGQLVVLPRDARGSEAPEEREARIRAVLEDLSGRYATGKSTDEVMRDLRGDWEP